MIAGATLPAEHPDDTGACDLDAPCAACAEAYGRMDDDEGDARMREDEGAAG